MYPIALSLLMSATPSMGVSAAACAHPNVPASTSDQFFTSIPTIASLLDQHGVTAFRVTLGANPGRPLRVLLERSSGLLAVDDRAAKFTQNATFNPEVAGCTAIAGDYFFEVES